MPTRHANVPRCPHCGSYGIFKRRRRWWQRLLFISSQYRCHECGKTAGEQAVRQAHHNFRGSGNDPSLHRNGA